MAAVRLRALPRWCAALSLWLALLAQAVGQDATPTPTPTPTATPDSYYLDQINQAQGQQTIVLLLILGSVLLSIAVRNVKF